MHNLFNEFWRDDAGQDIAEYAVILAVILLVVMGTARVIGLRAHTVFAEVSRAMGR